MSVQNGIDVVFRTAHGDRSLVAQPGESIVDLCRRYGLPTTQVSTYLEGAKGELTLFVKPREPFSAYASNARVVVFPNRNIDYDALLGGRDVLRERADASTWVRVRERAADGTSGFVTTLLDANDSRALVAQQVREALESVGLRDEPLVVGVSGGGDSNALLGAIVSSGLISKENVHPVMMLGIPDWDKGVERAVAICEEHGLTLRTVSGEETAKILGFVDPERDWVTAFEKAFPGDDLEVLGVYGVRRVLESIALEKGARRIVIGGNLEDCLADALYYICQGQVPFPKPCGTMGKVEILYPLWLTPKAVIDGCYPKYSRENYEARYPSRMFGRAYFYYLAQMLVDAYPGAGQDLLMGARKLSKDHFQAWPVDNEFGTPTMAPIPFDVRIKLRKLFGNRTVLATEGS
jgi:hypothetical protein